MALFFGQKTTPNSIESLASKYGWKCGTAINLNFASFEIIIIKINLPILDFKHCKYIANTLTGSNNKKRTIFVQFSKFCKKSKEQCIKRESFFEKTLIFQPLNRWNGQLELTRLSLERSWNMILKISFTSKCSKGVTVPHIFKIFSTIQWLLNILSFFSK